MLTRLYNRIRPRFRLGPDPLLPIPDDQRFVPITAARLRVIAPVRREILAKRKPCTFTVDHGKRLSIVIPFRNREPHLVRLLPALREALAAQHLEYRILVVEQSEGKLLNRGKLLNVGARHAWNDSDYFVFHDVDMIPETAEYGRPSQPLRLIKYMSSSWRGYERLSGSYFGGTASLNKEHMTLINGFSNRYWGWGKEDDDLLLRCLLKGLVPHEDTMSSFQDLDTPADEVAVKHQVVRRGSNSRVKSRVYRLQVDPHSDGLAEAGYTLLDERRDGDLWHIRVEI